jgi:FkbM family methyltransferase
MKYTQINLYPGDDYNDYEKATVDLFKDLIKDNWTVFDCGAKTGFFTLLFSEICENGVVHSFEPTSTYDMLVNNVSHYNITNTILNKLALGEKSGKIEDDIFRIWGQPAEKMVYEFITIDDYCEKNNIQKLDFMKIDVDSYDFDLLKGGIKTLQTLKPIITIELNYALNFRNATEQEVIDWLSVMDYSLVYVTNDQNHTFIHNTKL